MPNLHANIIEDTGLTEAFNQQNGRWTFSAVRAYKVTDLDDTYALDPQDLMSGALQVSGLPARFEAYGAFAPRCIVLSRQVLPYKEHDNAAKVLVTYGTLTSGSGGGGGSTFFTVSDKTSLVDVETQLLPGTAGKWKPITVKYTDANGVQFGPKTASIRYLAVLRRVVLQAFVQSNPDKIAAMRANMGMVNDDDFNGLPVGYWLFSDLDDETSDNQTYKLTAELMTQNTQNWSQAVIFIEPNNNQPVLIRANVAQGARAAPYKYDVDDTRNGLSLVGPYPPTDFTQIFGGNLNV